MERRRFHTAVQVFEVIHDLCPQYLRNWFIYAEAHTGRSGRNKYRLFVPQITRQISTSVEKSTEFFLSWSCNLESLSPVLYSTDRFIKF